MLSKERAKVVELEEQTKENADELLNAHISRQKLSDKVEKMIKTRNGQVRQLKIIPSLKEEIV